MKHHKIIKSILITILAVTFATVPAKALAAVTAAVKSEAGNGTFGFKDGSADQALFRFPYGLAIDNNGGLIIVDSYNNRIRLLKNNQVTTIAGGGDLTDASGFPMVGYVDGAVLDARFNHPRGVAVDSKGNIFISDTENNCIRILTDGNVYTFAGTKNAGYVNAKSKNAQFNLPSGMAIDSEDNLYIADTLNNVIRKISPNGEVTTFAGKYSKEGGYQDGAEKESLFNEPSDVAVDSEGSVYVVDSGNQLVRKIKDGVVSTVAGISSDKIPNTSYSVAGFENGSSDKAMFNFPMGIDVADDGTLFIADTWNHRIRLIKPDGSVGTLAGNGISGLTNGYADQSQFNAPTNVLCHNGILYISDMWNNSIRSMNIHQKTVEAIVDRSELAETYQLAETTDAMQVWYEGSILKLSGATPYKEGTKIYVPLKRVYNAWGAKVFWISKKTKLEVTKKGFCKIYTPGVDMTIIKDGVIYIDTESLSKLTKLRIEWFPEYNALVIENRP